MSFVDLHPHFVSARDYNDVKTVVGLLKDPIDDDDFERPHDAPFLPPTYTTTIHVQDSLSGVVSTRNSVSMEAPLGQKENPGKSAATGADAAHAPFGVDGTAGERSPFAPDLVNEPRSFQTNAPKTHAPPASTIEFEMRRRASSYRKSTHQPKILCVWDVDDTLVATGVSGVRQNLVFREAELVSLFRSAGPRTRHLLLSQGSIDDVFETSGGRLRCIQKFVQRLPQGAGRPGSPSFNPSADGSSAPLHRKKKEKMSFADMLRCGGGKQTKEPPSSSSSCSSVNQRSTRGYNVRHAEEGVGGTNEKDMRQFAPGTVVVRLSSVLDRAEEPADSAFLSDSTKQPTCRRSPTAAPLDEKAERMGRWLILRPEVWGITLASMNTIFPPSRHTAFVNGKVYRKMDVVWSLAMTGEWDSVFFIDNNLSEVGVVRYGMQMSDVLNLRSGRQVWRFFQSEFLLLAASAKLREMELRYGRDVTKPPPQPTDENTVNTVNTAAPLKEAAKSAGSSGELRAKSTATASRDGAGEGGELTPSKSTATSSTDSAPHDGVCQAGKHSRSCDRCRVKGSGEVHVDVAEDVHIIDRPTSALPHVKQEAIMGSSSCSESLSLTSATPQHPNGTSPRFPTSPPRLLPTPLRPSSKDVDFVVVNLHMPCEMYHRVLTTARTNSDGQCSRRREGSVPPQYVGQPVFIGDRSCTDEQYDAVLKYFQETESGLFQLLEEEMRMNGFVDVKMSSKWIPRLYTVYAPIRKRPTFIPHMPQFYVSFFDAVEEQVVKALQKHGGSGASCVLHSEAQRQYFVLQRVLPFIDPYLTGDLGRILFDIYIVDGNIPRSLADHLKKALNKVRERILPKADHK
ncbi:hypothetical protein ABB37_01270 [Leptomonas pyrrhocoris]|uniref:Uncharacterized protein n=1 Tax=Leptomonas pyrrhocoris TaxID=157538 RepID=A0A0N0DZ15_LEPPY|nr:hypothetical protein ABB37_01270 [Leptomonas pyrrhocoris]KPA84788.1 hypothetical protein ABB37_01270 [Leptomonas pyrrhocoris]|eukprot:XP_015663227.1 hypothetical protein ABB37_01270 [Leptomonas pyrrhocoris]